MRRTVLLSVLAALVVIFVALQLLPFRVSHPPVIQEPAWDSPRTAQLARTACYDCHSNKTRVPWYGHIAPVSWLVADHVDEGRAALNFSEMNRGWEAAHEAGEELREGEMPPRYYLVLHPQARLSAADKQALAAGLDATLGGEVTERDDLAREEEGRDWGEEEYEDEGEDEEEEAYEAPIGGDEGAPWISRPHGGAAAARR